MTVRDDNERAQAEQLWHVLVPEDQNDDINARSYSLPVTTGSDHRTPAPPTAAGPTAGETDTSNGSSSSYAAREAYELARSRARSFPSGPLGPGGRTQRNGRMAGGGDHCLDLHGFLHLADMLHVKAVESGGKEEGGVGGSGGRGPCYLAGYDDEEDGGSGDAAGRDAERDGDAEWDGDAMGFRSFPGKWGRVRNGPGGGGVPARENEGLREETDEEEDDSDDGEQSGGRQGGLRFCCPPSDEEGGGTTATAGEGSPGARGDVNGSASGGGLGGNASALLSNPRRLRVYRCASGVLQRARVAARIMVGRQWFCLASRGIAVLLAALALTWTPRSQQRYDDCPSPGEEGYRSGIACDDGGGSESLVDYRREDLLRRVEGGVLLAFLAEMAAKVPHLDSVYSAVVDSLIV